MRRDAGPPEPELGRTGFVCPHCDALAQQRTGQVMTFYFELEDVERAQSKRDDFGQPGEMSVALARLPIDPDDLSPVQPWSVTTCFACGRHTYWLGDRLAWPVARRGAPAVEAMPADVRELYDEARDVANRSPRAAATLLRVALERLVNDLVEGSQNLNDKIGQLVQLGLSPRVQRAMDTMRVFGNGGAHAHALDLGDTAERADALFRLINIIVQQVIVDTAAVDDLYEQLPPSKHEQIERRDGSSAPTASAAEPW